MERRDLSLKQYETYSKCVRVCSCNEGKVVMVNKNQEENPQHSHFLSQTEVVPSQEGKYFLPYFHMTSRGLKKLLLPCPGTRSVRGLNVGAPGRMSLASWTHGGLWAGSCSCTSVSPPCSWTFGGLTSPSVCFTGGLHP